MVVKISITPRMFLSASLTLFTHLAAGTGCGYCRQRNRTYRRRCPSSWDGYTDRAENRGKYTDCAGCNERGRSGNR